jgi:hypothetical protein
MYIFLFLQKMTIIDHGGELLNPQFAQDLAYPRWERCPLFSTLSTSASSSSTAHLLHIGVIFTSDLGVRPRNRRAHRF